MNRVSSSRLFDLARVLDVSIPWFFEEMSGDVREQTLSKLLGGRWLPAFEEEKDPLVRRETIKLVRAYYRITDDAIRRQLYNLIKTTSKVK